MKFMKTGMYMINKEKWSILAVLSAIMLMLTLLGIFGVDKEEETRLQPQKEYVRMNEIEDSNGSHFISNKVSIVYIGPIRLYEYYGNSEAGKLVEVEFALSSGTSHRASFDGFEEAQQFVEALLQEEVKDAVQVEETTGLHEDQSS